MRQPQRDAGQARGVHASPQNGGRIDIRELTAAEVEAVDRVLPLARLDTGQTYLVAWDRDEPVGHAHVAWQDTRLGVPEVQDVFVLAGHPRRGVATELLRRAESLVADRGNARISIGYGIANDGARRLYERLGYANAGLAPERVEGTITIRGAAVQVDDTLIYLVKDLPVDSGAAGSS